MSFEFATATRIIFGAGTVSGLGDLAAGLGSRPLLVRGRSGDGPARARELFSTHELEWSEVVIHGEPSVDVVRQGVQAARDQAADLVIAVGGGSVLDAGKAIAALFTNPGDVFDYLEVIGKGQPLTAPSLPFVAVPTTAGTGSEVTRNAVLGSPEHHVKVSLRSPSMLPRIALVDSELTLSLPPAVTAGSGLDALTQLVEPFVSVRANPLTDAICREGLRHARSLPRACENGGEVDARDDMALASLCGGLALSNAALGLVHGFAGPLGGMLAGAPHGNLCARLLPAVMESNLKALEARQPDSPALERYAEVARLLTGKPGATPAAGAAWVRELVAALDIPRLANYGMTTSDIPAAVEKAQKANSTKGNPIQLTPAEMSAVLEGAL